jgi:hypothetical protein
LSLCRNASLRGPVSERGRKKREMVRPEICQGWLTAHWKLRNTTGWFALLGAAQISSLLFMSMDRTATEFGPVSKSGARQPSRLFILDSVCPVAPKVHSQPVLPTQKEGSTHFLYPPYTPALPPFTARSADRKDQNQNLKDSATRFSTLGFFH